MEVLILRLEAPLMSFGGVLIDQFNRTELYPCRSLLTGLIANALGWDRSDAQRHLLLQDRIRYAARRDRPGSVFPDYQTVDFGADGPSASALAWTSRGSLEPRKGASGDRTHIRYRDYIADGLVMVALSLDASADEPSLDQVAEALSRPARPLFIGRKCCIPSGPILVARTTAADVGAALGDWPLLGSSANNSTDRVSMICEVTSDRVEPSQRTIVRTEDRDWNNSIHVGRREYREVYISREGQGS